MHGINNTDLQHIIIQTSTAGLNLNLNKCHTNQITTHKTIMIITKATITTTKTTTQKQTQT